MKILRVESGPRTSGGTAKRARTTDMREITPVEGTTAQTELDTRADTICCGINWKLLSTTIP